MSRNYTPEQTLIDQLLLDDTTAFEELYHRYCFSLYNYALNKLQSPEDARRLVRDIFIALWEQRHSLPINFSISIHLYTEIRKSVVKCINEKLLDQQDAEEVKQNIIPGFALGQLRQARQFVSPVKQPSPNIHAPVVMELNYERPWWGVGLRSLRHTFQHIMNFW